MYGTPLFCSPTYKEEEESRLQDFTDEELDNLSVGGDKLPENSPRLSPIPPLRDATSGHVMCRDGDMRPAAGRVPCLGLSLPEKATDEGRRRRAELPRDAMAQSQSNLSQLSESSDRFRDSIDTVVRVSLSSPQDSRTSTLRSQAVRSGPGPQLECMFR
jgi:hypothetical protein